MAAAETEWRVPAVTAPTRTGCGKPGCIDVRLSAAPTTGEMLLSVRELVLIAACVLAKNLYGSAQLAAYCPEDQDTVPGSSVFWNKTAVATTAVKPCSPGPGIKGNITRSCVTDSGSPTGGKWGEPNVEQCMTDEFGDIFDKVSSWADGRSISVGSLLKMNAHIINITHESALHAALYPSDITAATDSVRILATVAKPIESLNKRRQEVADSFTNMVSQLTAEETHMFWNNFVDKEMIGQRALTLLVGMETLASNFLHARNRKSMSLQPETNPKWANLTTSDDGTELQVQVIDINTHGEPSEISDTNRTTSIVFPRNLLEKTARYNNDSEVAVYKGQFSSLAGMLNFTGAPSPRELNMSTQLNSNVMSATVLKTNESFLQALEEPVVITFQHLEYNPNGEIGCYFINENSSLNAERWQTDNCSVYEQNSTHTVCHCYHLTSFALLMDIHGIGNNISESHQKALSYISYIGGSLSILGCVLAIACFQLLRINTDRARIHEMLALTISLSQLTFLIGIERKENEYVCRSFAILLHYFLTALFCWMLVEGIHLYLSVITVFNKSSHLVKYHFIGWGLPLINVGVTTAIFLGEYGSTHICWMPRHMVIKTFLPLVALVILVNACILVAAIYVMLRSIHSSNRIRNEDVSSVRMGVKASVVLLPLLGLTWAFGFLSVDPNTTLIFTYLFTICNSLQGVLFFVFHCLLNPDVKRGCFRRYHRQTSGSQSAAGASSARVWSTKQQLPRDMTEVAIVNLNQKRDSAYSSESLETNTTNIDGYPHLAGIHEIRQLHAAKQDKICKDKQNFIEKYINEHYPEVDKQTTTRQNNGTDDASKDEDVLDAFDALDMVIAEAEKKHDKKE